MKKSHLLGTVCALLLPLCIPSITYAASQQVYSNSVDDLLEAAIILEEIAITIDNAEAQSSAKSVQESIQRLTPEEFKAVSAVNYSALLGKLQLLQASLQKRTPTYESASVLTTDSTKNSSSFDPFPDADYPSVCGDTRSNAETVKLVALESLMFLEEAQALAEELLTDVRHAALETIVFLGEGGNTSLIAEPFDIAVSVARLLKVAAKAVYEDLEFFDNCINSAEIEGSYDRLGALGERTEEILERIDDIVGEEDFILERINNIEMREVENQLVNARTKSRALASLFLPADHGGQLEDVRDIVQYWIDQSANAGLDAQKAQKTFDLGEQHMADRQYREAYMAFAKAYRKTVSAKYSK